MDDIYQILRVRAGAGKAELQEAYARLADTYRLVRDFAEDRAASELAAKKLERLMAAGEKEGLKLDAPAPASGDREELAKLRMALYSSGANAQTVRASNLFPRIQQLPESAEKHYLTALAMLLTDSSFQGCSNAVPELAAAVKADPGNEAYRGMMDAVRAQLDAYQKHQQELDEKKKKEQNQELQRARDRVEQQRRTEITNNLLATLGYAFREWGLPLLGCCCVVECLKEGC